MSSRDRRRNRSRETLEAIHLQLQAVAERVGAVAVWIADTDGILLGASESEMDSEALAAYSSLPWRLDTSPPEQMKMVGLMDELDGYHVTFRKFDVDGVAFSLGFATQDPVTEEAREEAGRAITGVIRILGEVEHD